MAISWLAVLQSVPWSEVINNAPKVADGARKLWKTVARQPEAGTTASSSADSQAPSPPTLMQLASRQAALELELADLHAQMLTSSALIKDLAEQNTQLVRRVEATRVRTLWLAAATVALAVALLGVTVAWQSGLASA